jgi:hypothetical protein
LERRWGKKIAANGVYRYLTNYLKTLTISYHRR